MNDMNEPAPRAEAPADERWAALSALADGDAGALGPACALWREDPQARATWHAYHLIGDVLRSDELAASPSRDAAFLAALRTRLAAEPTVLAPAEKAPTPARRHGWLLPAAAAAGFAAVAGLLVVTRLSAPADDGPLLAVGPAPRAGLALAGGAASAPQPLVIDGRMIRDARLDGYLRAHREALGGVPAAVPGGAPRSVEVLMPGAADVIPVAR
jgi:sigma-E factor negative regulatory protein RseA